MPHKQRALRISCIVRNRVRRGNRVYYATEPDGTGEAAVAERVVLTRWRRRRAEGRVFQGSRLPPTLWRALPVALGPDVDAWVALSPDALAERLESTRDRLRTIRADGRSYRLPSASTLHALFAVLGRDRLAALVERHRDPVRHEHPGVPDLFLYATDRDGRVQAPRFVEVKKPKERVSENQVSEVAFLQALGMDARVLVLIERGAARQSAPPAPVPGHRTHAHNATVTPPHDIAA